MSAMTAAVMPWSRALVLCTVALAFQPAVRRLAGRPRTLHMGIMDMPRREALAKSSLPLAVAGLFCGAPSCRAGVEWSIQLLPNPSDWKTTKRLESVVRIRPETVLLASQPQLGLEVKIIKVPLGQAASASFSPEDQLTLSQFFEAAAERKDLTPGDGERGVADTVLRSLRRQAEAGTSALRQVYPAEFGDAAPKLYKRFSNKADRQRAYVRFGFESDTCPRLDVDGGCETKLERRRHVSVVTVGLETQARTLTERQMMDSGEMEFRQIDVLWLCTASSPARRWDETERTLNQVVDSFLVPVDS